MKTIQFSIMEYIFIFNKNLLQVGGSNPSLNFCLFKQYPLKTIHTRMNFYFTSFTDTRLLACQMLKQFGHFLLRQETVIVLVKILYSLNNFLYSWNQIYQKVAD